MTKLLKLQFIKFDKNHIYNELPIPKIELSID